ncbi:MAG TPA: GntR family transcriptional regulator [Hyphomicrobiales bacterium]|nr:GntR family transcriptional regulator [Hyphomicrobiales bacterium]
MPAAKKRAERRAAPEPDGLRQPLYVHIASTLQERIVAGTYPMSSLLPTEADLTEEFATSRNTVREALRLLVERRLVRRRQGAGTVVISAAPAANYVQSFTKLDDLFANSRNTYYALHTISTVQLEAGVADRIGACEGEEWLQVQGVRWTERGGTPIAYIESYIPTEFKAIVDTFVDLEVPFYSVLEKASGRTIDEVTQEIRALGMPRHVANAFGMPEGSTSLQLLRRYVARGGILIASINWHRADQFTYEMVIHRRVDREPQ